MAELITEDHVFIDALGNSMHGREKMRAGFRVYYAMCPDYQVSHHDIFHNGNTVAVLDRRAALFGLMENCCLKTSGKLRPLGAPWSAAD